MVGVEHIPSDDIRTKEGKYEGLEKSQTEQTNSSTH